MHLHILCLILKGLSGQASYIQGGPSQFGLGIWGELYVKISEMEKHDILKGHELTVVNGET